MNKILLMAITLVFLSSACQTKNENILTLENNEIGANNQLNSQVIVKFKPQLSTFSVNSFVNQKDAIIVNKIENLNIVVIQFNQEINLQSVIDDLNSDPIVEYAEPNHKIGLF